MFMMTFSPISIRPSSVADPMCGRRTTFGSSTQPRVEVGAAFVDVKPGPGQFTGPQGAGQGVLVDHLTARGVHHHRRGLHQLQPPRVQKVKGRRRVRAVDRQDVHPGQHLVQAFPVGRLQLGPRSRGAGACGCGNAPAARRPAPGAPPPGRSAPCPGCPAAARPAARPGSPSATSLCQSPDCITCSPCGMRRVTARISAITMSAVSSVTTPGVFDTRIPRCRAVATSIWSKPAP